jgi:molybdopterin-containing oxidoreductase family iron-sulfur binding subunit
MKRTFIMSDQSKNGLDQKEPMSLDDMTYEPLTRRSFLKVGIAATALSAGGAISLSPLRELDQPLSISEFLQQHYEELTPPKMEKVLARIKREIKREYKIEADIRDTKPLPGVEFAYALNIGRCIGCRRCVYACMEENNLSRDPEIQYIRVLEMDKGTMDLETSNHYYDPETVPQKNKFYVPVQCHQCKNAPCTKACPIKATWQEPDGIVVVDYNWCIGCRYCLAACPYWARRFNFAKPKIPREDINTKMDYLSNRIRPRGVAEKCTFCLHRTRQGMLPACAEVCPTGSRIFGNILEPDNPISYILKNKRVYVLKEELRTFPRFYYFFEK